MTFELVLDERVGAGWRSLVPLADQVVRQVGDAVAAPRFTSLLVSFLHTFSLVYCGSFDHAIHHDHVTRMLVLFKMPMLVQRSKHACALRIQMNKISATAMLFASRRATAPS